MFTKFHQKLELIYSGIKSSAVIITSGATSGASKSEPIYDRVWQVTKSALGFQTKQRPNMKNRISFTKPVNKLLVWWRILKSYHRKAQIGSFNESVSHDN